MTHDNGDDMTQQAEVTLGEIYRTVQRLEAALSTVQMSVEPISVLVVRVDTAEQEIRDLRVDVKAVRRDAAVVSGGIGVMGFLASIWPWHR